jgi:hypothetical protein
LDPVALSRELVEAAKASAPVADLDGLAARLTELAPAEIAGDDARIAFWVNTYNALVLHELARRPRTGSLLRHRALFREAAYEVGGLRYSPDVIEHGLLRLNARPPLRLRRTLRLRDPRRAAGPARLDPRIHFALNCAAASCPPVRSYSADGLEAELDLATRSHLGTEIAIDRERGRVTLPYLLKLYRRDFGGTASQITFAAAHLPAADASWLRDLDASYGRVEYGPYDWTIAI